MSKPVGPGRPPLDGRFKKGQSGNPGGRPRTKKTQTGSAFDIVMDKTLTVTKNGVPRELTVEEALLHQTYQKAIEGSRPAQRRILKMILKRERHFADQKSRTTPAVDIRFEHEDPDNANQAMLILGIVTRDEKKNREGSKYDHLLLEAWAVQSALSRRRGGRRLSDTDIVEIKRCTRDADTLRWPRSVDK